MVLGAVGCPSASITMSARSSELDVVGVGAGVGLGGLAFAKPIDIAESPTSTTTPETTRTERGRTINALASNLLDVNRSLGSLPRTNVAFWASPRPRSPQPQEGIRSC